VIKRLLENLLTTVLSHINGVKYLKILITGTHGFLGGRISNFLTKRGFNIVFQSRKKTKKTKKISLASPKELQKILKGVDVIINCIGLDSNKSINKKKTNYVNSLIPYELYKAANKSGIKYFFYISTYHVYNFKKKKINENTKPISKNIYTDSKILGEKKIINNIGKTKLVILRLCNLFGYPVYNNKNSETLLINYIISCLAKKKTGTIKASHDEFRYYSSMKSFNFYLLKLFKNINKVKFIKGYKIFNYFTDKCYKITDLVKVIQPENIEKKYLIKFKHKNLKKRNKFILSSLNQKFLPKKDNFFFEEIAKTFSYYKKKKL